MANYGLYKSIDTGSLTSAASSIKTDASNRKTAITNLNNGLSDSIWKCGAKATLKEGLDKISGEVIDDINSSLDNLVTVAGYIASYKTAEQTAIGINNAISTTPNTKETAGYIASLYNDLAVAEADMDTYENLVKGML